jgi:hypothetical protein
MKFLTIGLFCLILLGCGSASNINLNVKPNEQSSFIFSDERTDKEKNGESESYITGEKIYSDKMLTPNPDTYVKSELQIHLGEVLTSKKIILKNFRVSVYDSSNYGRLSPPNNAESLAFTVAFLPLFVALAADSAVDGVNANQIVSTYIAVQIDGKLFTGGMSEDYKGHVGNKEVSEAVKKSMDMLIFKIKSGI